MERYMEEIIRFITTYGPWPVVIGLLVYIVIKGSFTFTYPRSRKNSKE